MLKNWIIKNKYKIIWTTVEILLVLLLAIFLGYTLGGYEQYKNPSDWNNIDSGWVILSVFILELVNLICLYYFFSNNTNKRLGIRRSSKSKIYGDARFLIDERNKTSNQDINELNKVYPNNCVGWILKSKYDKKSNQTTFNIANVDSFAHHLLVLGATRSGKTQLIVLLTIIANAKIVENNKTKKPSFVITDIKGELCRNTYLTLKENGYDVLVLNFKNPSHSNTWNPLFNVTKSYVKAELLKKQEITRETQITIDQEIEFADNLLREVSAVLFPINDNKDAIWDTLAQSIFLCAYYYSLETFIEQYVNDQNITEEELYKLADNINLASVISVLNNKEQLKKYITDIATMTDKSLQAIYMKKKSYETGIKVFSSPDATLGSAYANVDKATSNYSNESIKKLITSNDIDLSKIANETKPTAVFIIIAEGDEKSYKLLAMFVDQLYSFSIKKAETYADNKLSRNLLLILDEFCNMPKLNHASQFFTLGAGRRIMAMVIVQSLTQLNDVYGDNIAKTIIDNCATHAYIKSIDDKTNKYYSDWAGTYTAENTTISNNKENKSSNVSLTSMNLLTKEELLNNPNKDGYLIAFSMNNNPAYLKSNFFYQCNDLNNKVLDNESEVIDFNLIKVDDHLYNPFLFQNNTLNQWKQEQTCLELKQEFRRLINNYIDNYEKANDPKNAKNNARNQEQLDNVIKKINIWVYVKEHELYTNKITEFDNANKFLINEYIKNHLKELNPIGPILQSVLNATIITNTNNEIQANKDNQLVNNEEKKYEDFN